jgi:staphyloferrin B biosynthesis citrate synthase
MLKPNALKQKLHTGQEVFGLFCSIPSPVAVELVAAAGFDFVIIDTEHVLINPETIEHMIRAADAANITALVRVADMNPKTMLRILDAGAQGIVVPNLETAAQARALVAACKYHPLGMRSLNGGRPGAYGKHSLVDYMALANRETLLIPMIESQAGVEAINDIVAVAGIDMVLEGAADLSQSCGLPWQIQSQTVQLALQQLERSCQGAGIPYCTVTRAPDDLERARARGLRAFVMGDERGIAFRALYAKRQSAQPSSLT